MKGLRVVTLFVSSHAFFPRVSSTSQTTGEKRSNPYTPRPRAPCAPPYTRVTDHEPSMNAITVRRCRSLAEWLAASDAGKSLWHLSFGTPGQGRLYSFMYSLCST